MKKTFLICSLALLGMTSVASVQAERVVRPTARAAKSKSLEQTCKRIQGVNFLIKADISHHIPGGDARAQGFTIIGSGRNCSPCPSGCDILYADGTKAGSVGYYAQWSRSHGGNGCARYYGASGGAPAHSANAIISTARRKGRKLYLSNRRGTCYEWSSDSRRVGSP